jgi:hypothetical protein
LAIERAIEEASFIALEKPEAAEHWLDGLFAAGWRCSRIR